MSEKPDEPLITLREAAELLGVRPTTLQQWVWQKRVPVVRLAPRMLRFRPETLREWVREREEIPQPPAGGPPDA